MKRRLRSLSVGAGVAALALVGAPAAALAGPQTDEMPVAFGADQLRLDARTQALEASGNVHVDQPPFHLMSDDLTLRHVPIGVELAGKGVLVFCPCLGAPLSLRFSGATVAPPHDVVLRDPVLQVFGVPVLWAPAFWLRSPGRFGLLPPEVAWRGADGLFVGGGLHVPWRTGEWSRGVDLQAGGYVQGGAAVGVTMRTTVGETQLRWDDLRGDSGVALVLTGATDIAKKDGGAAAASGRNGEGAASAAWAVDALRGARAVKATTDVDIAAFPFDQAEGASTWRSGGWTWSTGVVAFAPRGADLLDGTVGGPMALAHGGDAIARAGSYDVGIEGGTLGGAGLGTLSYARGEGGALLATTLGVVGASVALRAIGDIADDGARHGADGAAQVRVGGGVPLSRGFASGDEEDPWIHRTEPRLEAAVIATHASDVSAPAAGQVAVPPGRGMAGPEGLAWVGAAAWHNAFGRWGSRASGELDAYAGAVGDGAWAQPLLRARAAVGGEWLGLDADFARVASGVGSGAGARGAGGVLLGRVRVGAVSSWLLSLHVAGRDGVDPVLARLLVDAPLEPASGFLVAPGWTGGARAGVPLGARVTLRGGADVDFDARALVAALGALEVHDPCGCVVVRTSASHRIGRSGVDVWLTVDLPRL